MSEIAIVATLAKSTLLEIAKQTSALGTGLQNASPGNKTGAPNHSIQYLLDTSENLTKIALEYEKMLSSSTSSGTEL